MRKCKVRSRGTGVNRSGQTPKGGETRGVGKRFAKGDGSEVRVLLNYGLAGGLVEERRTVGTDTVEGFRPGSG